MASPRLCLPITYALKCDDSYAAGTGETMARRAAPAIILLGLALRVAYTVSVYGIHLGLDYPGDYWDYHIAARQILAGDRGFTHDVFLARPPLYPLIVAAFDVNRPLLLMLNQLFALVIIPLTYKIARQLRLPVKLSLLAALVVALDPTSVKYSGILLAEPLANLLLALAFVALLALKRAEGGAATAAWGLLAGGFIALAAFARPAAYLLAIPLAGWIVGARWRQGLRVMAALALTLPSLLGVGLWQAHNARVFDNGGFTNLGAFNLLYYRAAITLHVAQGRQDLDAVKASLARQVEARLGGESETVAENWRQEHRVTTSEADATMRDVALEVIIKHPAAFVLATIASAWQSLIEVWGALSIPGAIWNVALLLAASLGLWTLCRRRRWIEALYLLLPCAYFLTGTLLVCTSCMDTRARVMITPLLAIMAAYGVMHILNRRRTASAGPSRPAGN